MQSFAGALDFSSVPQQSFRLANNQPPNQSLYYDLSSFSDQMSISSTSSRSSSSLLSLLAQSPRDTIQKAEHSVQKQPRKRGAKKQTEDEKETCSVPRTTRRRNTATRKQKTTTENEELRIHLQQTNTEQNSLNRTEQKYVQYGVDGKPLSEHTITSHTQNQGKQQAIMAMIEYHRTQCVNALKSVESLTLEECKPKSQTFMYIDRKIRAELCIFKKQVRVRLNNDTSRVWTDYDFIARFLFGLETHWEDDAQLPIAEVPWLACLWTMPEMLQLCHDKEWIYNYCSHRHQRSTFGSNPASYPAKLFCVNDQMIAGYVSGQLFAHAIPLLQNAMRDVVKQELTQTYFPCFDKCAFSEYEATSVWLHYDFEDIDDPLGVPYTSSEEPRATAPHCSQQGITNIVGTSFDEDDLEFDYVLVQLIGHDQIRKTIMNHAHAEAQKVKEHKKNMLTQDEMMARITVKDATDI